MNDQQQRLRVEGIVRARGFDPNAQGKLFLGAVVECSDGTVWVLSYEEQSPYHALANHAVVVVGEPRRPSRQHLIGWTDGRALGHLQALSVRLVGLTGGVSLVEIGVQLELCGRFDRAAGETSTSALSFHTENGDSFAVLNDPAGASCDARVTVSAYPIRLARPAHGDPYQYLWVICPYSAPDLSEWRRRRS